MSTIVCIGDSLTYGKEWVNNSGLRTPLNVRLSAKYPNVNVINLGVNGETTSQIYTRRASVNTFSPYRVIVWAGINDITMGIPEATIKTNLQNLYSYYSSLDCEVWAFTITPVDNETNTIRNSINSWIKNTATDVDFVVDAFSVIADPSNLTKRLSMYADPNTYNHINDLGMKSIVDVIT